MYQLTLAVSRVLDAMDDTRVTDPYREKLHEPLSTYLSELKMSLGPYMVYQTAYVYQALVSRITKQCIPLCSQLPYQKNFVSSATGTCLRTLTGHDDQVQSVAFSPCGDMVASASLDKTVRLWIRQLEIALKP